MKRNLNFEVTPLDINIVKIQVELIKELDGIQNRAEDFRFEHRFESLNPTLDLSDLEIFCYHNTNSSASEKHVLEVNAFSKKRDKKSYKTERFDSFEELYEAIDDKSFLSFCKKVVFSI